MAINSGQKDDSKEDMAIFFNLQGKLEPNFEMVHIVTRTAMCNS